MKIRCNRMHHLYKKIVSGIVVSALVFGVTVSYQDVCYAEPDASVEQARQDREEAAQLRDQAQRELNNLTNIRDGLKDKIIELDLSITKMQAQITELEMDQKKLEESIKATQADLKEAQEAEEQQYNLMKQRIQMVYESGNKGYLDVLLTATSMTDVMNKMEYTSQVSLYDYNLLTGLQDAKSRVAGIKQKLQLDLSTNESLQKKVSSEKENMEGLVEEKNEQMERYEVSIEEQTEELQRYQQAVAEAEAIIAAAEQAALQESVGTAYTGGAFTWPIPGYYDISSYFGERTSPTAGASSNHMGIDIRCGSGVPVVAAASGRVIVATYNYAEGNYVAIDHGGGVVTLYMHNSSLAVSVGQQVNGGDVIAYSGSTGISTGPHLHFGVRVNGSYVDPLSYLQ